MWLDILRRIRNNLMTFFCDFLDKKRKMFVGNIFLCVSDENDSINLMCLDDGDGEKNYDGPNSAEFS